jgi:hypothetical protein
VFGGVTLILAYYLTTTTTPVPTSTSFTEGATVIGFWLLTLVILFGMVVLTLFYFFRWMRRFGE